MNYIMNNYRSRKIDDKYLVTTDHGSFVILSEQEMMNLKNEKINEELYNKLEEKEIVLTETNMSEAVRLLRNRNSFLSQGTSLHIIVPTLRCNMNCVYCHASSKGDKDAGVDMDVGTAKKTVDFIFQTPSDYITIEFQGGEPLLNWDVIRYIIEYAGEKNKAAKKDLKLTMVTNLSLMTEEKMNYLVEKDVAISTSLDGPKKVHDFNRTFVKGSNHEQVVHWIKKIQGEYNRKKSKHRVGALVTITRESLKYPKEIIDEYASLGLKSIHLRFLNNLGMAKNAWRHINYSSDEYLKFWTSAVEYIDSLNEKENKIRERIITIMSDKMFKEFDPNYFELRSPCGAAIGQLTYNYDGKIYTCDEARMIGDELFHLGNVIENNYAEIVTGEKACAVTAASINDQYTCNDCAYKPYCGLCPVCNYAEQGSVVAKIPNTERCKIFMAQFDWVVKNRLMK